MKTYVRKNPIKIGALYVCRIDLHGSVYKPQKVIRNQGEVSWEVNKSYLMKTCGLNEEEAYANTILTLAAADSIVVPIEITDESQLLKAICGKKVLWFNLPHIVENKILLPFKKIKK
jgi:hypothetical protein